MGIETSKSQSKCLLEMQPVLIGRKKTYKTVCNKVTVETQVSQGKERKWNEIRNKHTHGGSNMHAINEWEECIRWCIRRADCNNTFLLICGQEINLHSFASRIPVQSLSSVYEVISPRKVANANLKGILAIMLKLLFSPSLRLSLCQNYTETNREKGRELG